MNRLRDESQLWMENYIKFAGVSDNNERRRVCNLKHSEPLVEKKE